MIRDIPRFSKNHYDVLIVGGGINGAATAYLAALVGAKVALLEKDDFAAGTSSKSTKLFHGGIRYLENLEFDLVAESLKERYIQYKNAPHLVRLLSFIIPVYHKDKRPLWMMTLGVWLYDLLSGRYSLGKHQKLTPADIIALAPHIRPDGLVGGVSYFDVQMNDVRVCLENVLMADLKGAHVANQVEVVDFLKDAGKCFGVAAKDKLTGHLFDIKAKTVIVAAGPWADQLHHKDVPREAARLRTTKGAHILYRGQVAKEAFLIQSSSDKRIFFVIPFGENSLIGTTDTDYQGKPDDVKVERDDVAYLLQEAARVFPQVNFKQENIITTFAGLRPLVFEQGSPSKISRKHSIEKSFSNIWYVLGGKYTTYRSMAHECVHKALPALSHYLPKGNEHVLYGSGPLRVDPKPMAARFGVTAETVTYLSGFYGSRYQDVLKLIDGDSSLRVKLCSCSLAIRAQVAYALEVEMAQNTDDIFSRRLQLQYHECASRQCKRNIEDMVKSHVF